MTTPTTIIIFGASGDLTQRKLVPALFNLYRKGRLPDRFFIIGFSSTPYNDDTFRERMRTGIIQQSSGDFYEDQWHNFAGKVFYCKGRVTNQDELQVMLDKTQELENGPANRIYYLATPPQNFLEIIIRLGQIGLFDETQGFRRVVIEKPFGTDLPSARSLNHSIHQVLNESQIYRIDHYLGKETVQNLLVFRFANAIFEPIWNRNYIDNVQITVAESVGVEHRARFYDSIGVLKDMFQNHLLQLLTLIAMEPPSSFQADHLRNEKSKVLMSVRPMGKEEIWSSSVRAQYIGYCNEPGVESGSTTPTYAALRLYIENWRWQGVPFYLRSGKKMAEKTTELSIQFKAPPITMFSRKPGSHLRSNILTMCLQPDEGIHLRFEAKVPDTVFDMKSVLMEFHYGDTFGASAIPDAYERLLLDVLNGDASLFNRDDNVELAWSIIDPIQEAWDDPNAPPLVYYQPGSWGPEEANQLLAADGFSWLPGCNIHSNYRY